MIVIAQTLKKISQAKETLIFLLQNLGFVINFKKSQLTPVKEIEFLGLLINSGNIKLALPQEKVLDIQIKCMQFIAPPKSTIMELTKFLEKLSFTAQAVLPGRIQCKYLQQQQFQAVRGTNAYQTKIKLSQQSLAEMKWWKENLLLQNSKPQKIRNTTVNNPNGAFQNRLESSLSGNHHRGRLDHIRKGQNISLYWSSLQ